MPEADRTRHGVIAQAHYWRATPCTKNRRGDNWDISEGIERQEIGVASPETIRSAWMATASSRNLSSVGSRHAAMDRDQLGDGHQLLQPGPRVGIDEGVKVRAGNDLE
jgi:hypothetical protein